MFLIIFVLWHLGYLYFSEILHFDIFDIFYESNDTKTTMFFMMTNYACSILKSYYLYPICFLYHSFVDWYLFFSQINRAKIG